MKCIPVQEAVGAILCHDITQILPGEFKGRRFKKGHIIQEEDIPVLLSLGKDNIYVWENLPGMVHENDAATFLKDITMGDGLTFGEIKEGKITFTAAHDGLLKVDADRLFQLNMLGEISFASLHNNLPGYEDVGGDVDKVLGKRCVICAFPSRWYMGDGSKVRMVAVINKEDMNDVPDRVYKYGTY